MAGDSEDDPKAAAGPIGPEEPAPRPSGLPPRPSAPPPPPAPPRNGRLLVAALWVIAQVVLVATAGRRADGAFGFRMFAESAVVKVALYRDVRDVDASGPHTSRLHVDAGVWSARGRDGKNHKLTWYDRVPAPFWAFDTDMHASYGASTQLARLQAALDDVSTHTPDDVETERFVLAVTIRRNGREAYTTQLVGPPRLAQGPN